MNREHHGSQIEHRDPQRRFVDDDMEIPRFHQFSAAGDHKDMFVMEERGNRHAVEDRHDQRGQDINDRDRHRYD
ncbi:unnamed protein product, partial [Mesorhabditis spiculigera]